TMVESGSYEVSEELLVDALELAHSEIKKIIALIRQMKAEIGKPEIIINLPERIPEIDSWIKSNLDSKIDEAVRIHEKKPRNDKIEEARKAALDNFQESFEEREDRDEYISAFIDSRVKDIMRHIIIDEGIRVDGRAMDEIRPITCETGVLPRVHGSALFTRGETQSLAVTTLGMVGEDDQILDGIKLDEPAKRFILHYNFPPYSVGEVRPMRGPGRREIGHGALAERALVPVIPSESDFPYVIRVVSDILESNGSSSQASICGGSLSMMNAGVPLRSHVAGIAMGLIKEGEKVKILTDIQGLEDHYGDMDFKVAGTRHSVTALQMDNKAGGITREILEQALMQARKARMEILDMMDAAVPEPLELSPNAPRILSFFIDPEKISDVIGPGGKVIRSITQRTGVKMNVEDSGQVSIAGATQAQVDEAHDYVLALTKELEAGEIYWGTVTRLMAFGAFVECLPGKEGLLHVSEISTSRVPRVEDVFKPGDRVIVMVKEIDDQGRVNLTRRRLLTNEEKIRAAGLERVLPEEREREHLISDIASASGYGDRDRDRDRGYRDDDRGRMATLGSRFGSLDRERMRPSSFGSGSGRDYDRDRDRGRSSRSRRDY
ncbi:MAG: polyribonucleotide nucleotidyltransferase, partial [Synergistaceae bacterium]|nr:polyribonucleotide nucleotidyltransferase [Synergistaceae bacterium]